MGSMADLVISHPPLCRLIVSNVPNYNPTQRVDPQDEKGDTDVPRPKRLSCFFPKHYSHPELLPFRFSSVQPAVFRQLLIPGVVRDIHPPSVQRDGYLKN